MSLDLGHLLQAQLGNVLNRFVTAHGESAESSAKATGLAIPAVIAGLVKHISGNPANAGSLFDLVKGSTGHTLDGAVEQAESGHNINGLIDLGENLLPNLFGSKASNVADQIAVESGISKASAGSLLSLALPLVLSGLRGEAQKNDLNKAQLLGLLGQQQGWLSQVLSGNMLSALGISSLSGLFGGLTGLLGGAGAATAATAATAAAASSGSGLGKWIALALAAAVGFFAFKSCSTGQPKVEPAPAQEAAAPAAAVEPEAEPAVALNPDTALVTYEDGVAKFYFATAKKDVADGAEMIVADVIAAGKEGKKLVVSGFADSTGNAAANAELSKQRAQAVKAFFEAQGVDAANIELRKPESTTGAIGNDVEGRRVEVRVEG
ncbi:OmpA family protein [Neisseria weaveri]|uniref:OmpA family protein n=1 Tax=Neisseria weaveri TaxID=28091 RepID=UPI000D315267|nr:OmpA family protein [Neisseria weaveri]